ncbi:hypothetical protein C5B90_19945, partial [Haloferax sp. Atlit-12N]
KFVNHSEVRQSPFFVQLKATEKFDGSEVAKWQFQTSYLIEDCLSASIPVVLCLYERSSDQFYWCILQSYCWDVLDEQNPEWRSQTYVQIQIDREPLETPGGMQRLMRTVSRAQRRITMRSSIASQRRGTFANPPGTQLASTEEVRRHKRELVEDAHRLAIADHLYRALSRVMYVYQLPEDDRPRLDAICYLLALRVTTAPDIALAKLRLANHGLALADSYDEPDVQELVEDLIDSPRKYLKKEFIGARYLHTKSGRECLVLEVV